MQGVIIPPPDIRAVVNKTAQFVAKNGKAFEGRILNSAEGKTAKFSFMQTTSPFYGYYEERISFFETGGTLEAEESARKAAEEAASAAEEAEKAAREQGLVTVTEEKQEAQASVVDPVAKAILAARSRMVADRNKDPVAALNNDPDYPDALDDTIVPPAIIFATVIDPIQATEMEISTMKLSARFTACCGRDFLTSLIRKETLNPLFDFLKPTSPNFAYFTALVDSYLKIMAPSEADVARISSLTTVDGFLAAAAGMAAYRQEMEIRKNMENEGSEGMEAAMQVDWGDFVVVETVEFTDADMDQANPAEDDADMDMAESDEEVEGLEGGDGEGDETIKVVQDYNPRIQSANPNDTSKTHMLDPITNQLVPISQMAEHMRIQLLDPKWREQQARASDKQKDSNIAAGESIVNNLQSFAKSRGDIFGTTEQDRLQQKANDLQRSTDASKMLAKYADKGQEQQQAQPQQARQQQPQQQQVQQQQVQPQPQLQAPPAAPMGRGRGISNAPAWMQGKEQQQSPQQAPAAQPTAAPPAAPMGRGRGVSNAPAWMATGEPAAKRARTDVPILGQNTGVGGGGAAKPPSLLAPAAPVAAAPMEEVQVVAPVVVLATGSVDVSVRTPVEDSYGLTGQIVNVTIDVGLTIKKLLELVSAQISVPVNKLQLKFNGAFTKPAHTLAMCDIKTGASVELVVKTRGGKK